MKRKRVLSADPITTTINSLSHDGRGIASLNGKTTFISGALTGEEVSFKLTKRHPRYNEGEILEIMSPSAERVKPGCEHFGICGGCSMQHLAMSAQIELKQKTLLEQLKHFGHVEPETILPPLSGNIWGYRRKARLGVRWVQKKEKMFVGFREKSSRYLAEIVTCPVLHPSVGERLPEISQLILSLKQFEQIPQIEVAVGDNATALVIRHMVDLDDEDLKKLAAFGEKYQFQIFLQPNSPAPFSKLYPNDQNYRLTYALADYQLQMQFHPLDFTQVNGEVNPLMIQQALALLDTQPTDKVLDLFCGLGNFTLPLARFAEEVVGVEGSQEMVDRAKDNATLNDIHNTAFYAANLAEIPAAQPAWMQKKYDKILLDPPRTGAKEIIALFPKLGAKRIVYVSCNPATLARDAGILVKEQGYKLKKVGVINMFPHTSHIEAIALFEKK
ncbi:MAG: 23S rRNA (uracil(1939)-C(5))-methyltransferase RlmD [Gammaproteobacteria bacterium]|nr:23S rRNA (uracil(1939)-C(5))-methyltransferase RlmD [Gammaproteobacteria bacterium]